MQGIATKTKILAWSIVGEKEKIDFELCDFSPDQVAALERFVRHPDDKVRVTLEPEDKKLQIEAITSGVRIVSIALRAQGQKIKLADFHSPDTRAQALKRLSANETPIVLTIEPIQGQLFDEKSSNPSSVTRDPEKNSDPSPVPRDLDDESRTTSDETTPWRTVLEDTFKAKGLKQATVVLTLQTDGAFWRCGYTGRLGNFTTEEHAGDADSFATREICLENTRAELRLWLNGLDITGKADQRRSMARRRDAMAEQLDRWMIAGIQAASAEEAA